MSQEVFIPKLGQTVEEVTLIRWLVEDGMPVKQGQEILEVETDKAVFQVEANDSGHIHLGPFQKGDVIPVLEVVAIIGAPDDKFKVRPRQSSEKTPALQNQSISQAPVQPLPSLVSNLDNVFASPRARKLAREKHIDLSVVSPTGGGGTRIIERDILLYLQTRPRATPVAERVAIKAGVNLGNIHGTGPRGMITKEDVTSAVQQAASTFSNLPGIDILERVPLKGVRGTIAKRMALSAQTTARVTLFMEVDASEFVEARRRIKEKVEAQWGFAPGYNEMLIRVAAMALREYIYINARLTSNSIEHLDNINIGLAVDTGRGLLVPVIRDADDKGLYDLGLELRELVTHAREGHSPPDDLAGGTFTITNLGMYDVDAFTPIINYPEAAILGVGRITPKLVLLNGEINERQSITLTLAFDHRIVDGGPAARFLQRIKELIEAPHPLDKFDPVGEADATLTWLNGQTP
jgi:pyruvate dehydrogenase E2 component (dihydrolipoamide acetyltransferase)